MLRLALGRMKSIGFDTFNVGPEVEYFLFRDDKGTVTLDEGGYFAMTTLDAATDAAPRHDPRTRADGHPDRVPPPRGRPVAARDRHAVHERADMADHMVTYRLIVKEIAKKPGYHATFMPKPLFGENGSGMHTHQSLFTDGRNASSTETTSGTSQTSERRSSPASFDTPGRSPQSSPSG